MKIKFMKMRDSAIIPTFGHGDTTNAGIDMYACLEQDFISIAPYSYAKIPLGVAWEPEAVGKGKKAALILKGRSGLASQGIEASQGTEAGNGGVIDEGYRGEISAILYNNSSKLFIVRPGDRIVQGIPVALPNVEIEETDELSTSARGNRGFGSSGI